MVQIPLIHAAEHAARAAGMSPSLVGATVARDDLGDGEAVLRDGSLLIRFIRDRGQDFIDTAPPATHNLLGRVARRDHQHGEGFMGFRRPTSDESRLLRELATLAEFANPDAWVETLRVRELDDSGMGSLEIECPDSTLCDRGVIGCLTAVQFTDADGVEVIASLNAREDGVPFELDIWKTDFTRLIQIPLPLRQVEE